MAIAMEGVMGADTRKDQYYGPSWYKLTPEQIAEFKRLTPHRPVLAALEAFAWIFILVKAFVHIPWAVYFYPVLAFLIAGRAGVFLQLAHEAAHGLISRGKFNNWFGDWVASYPIGLDFRGYAEPHAWHHACTNKVCDPASDSEKYKVCDVRNPRLWMLFFKDLTGITAITIRFLYDNPESNSQGVEADQEYLGTEEVFQGYRAKSRGRWDTVKKYFCISLVQLLMLAVIFDFNIIHYLILWLIPLMTAHMFLMRVRGIAEHGLGIQLNAPDLKQKNRGTFYTRSFGTPVNCYGLIPLAWLERALIGSLNVYYHHEHHLFPKVPYYNLPKLHKLIHKEEYKNNPYIFARGYFDCLFFNLRRDPAMNRTPAPVAV